LFWNRNCNNLYEIKKQWNNEKDFTISVTAGTNSTRFYRLLTAETVEQRTATSSTPDVEGLPRNGIFRQSERG
jgi:hypothetical protein